ncbi:MAG: hypothetical protein C4519_25130 [Desulfobacteraceae bacterium]|nr:MAG: hypothetical protein C4519_25130 [Desulfobacteraceae bacterium]
MRLLVLCVVVPIALHVLGGYAIEAYAKRKYSREIGSLYIGSTELLFAGSIRLADAITRNVDGYLDGQMLVGMGLSVKVTVVTEAGLLLYPNVFPEQPTMLETRQMLQVARENYQLLNARPTLRVDVALPSNAGLSLALLAFYVVAALGVLAFNYRRGMNVAREQDLHVQNEIDRLRGIEQRASENLGRLEIERSRLTDQLQRLSRELECEKQRVSVAEDTMIEEMVALEEKLQLNLALQNEKNEEIAKLKGEIDRYGSAEIHPGDRRRQKEAAQVIKRFKALYKGIVLHERAAEGFSDLTDEMQIKAEEVIYQLNHDPDKVVIKRKVFGKKNSATAFEVIFAYRGRLYFSRTPSNSIKVLAIGTKHSQERDLAFLEKL